jgi:MoxR-like ATPase
MREQAPARQAKALEWAREGTRRAREKARAPQTKAREQARRAREQVPARQAKTPEQAQMMAQPAA